MYYTSEIVAYYGDYNKRYIDEFFRAVDIEKIYKKEMNEMEVDTEKLKAYLADLETKRDNAIAIALEDKDNIVEERLNEAKETIPIQVEKELTDNAEAPYKHDIELCKSFLKQEEPKQEEPKI